MSKPVQFLWRPHHGSGFAVPEERDDASASERACHRAAVAAWAELFPAAVVDPETDYEDWHENAAKLLAALGTGRPVFQLDLVDPTRVVRSFRAGVDGRPLPFDREAPCALVGDHLKFDPLVFSRADMMPALGGFVDFSKAEKACWDVRPEQILWPSRGSMRANEYPRMEAFRRNAGRRAVLCGIPCEGPLPRGADLHEELVAWAASGPVDAMLKVVAQAKYEAPARLRLPAGAGADAVHEAVRDALGYTLLHLEGVPEGILLQDRVPMAGEYRFVVVDHRLAAGAGCIEKFAPISSVAEPFDPQIEGRRGDDDIRPDPAAVARYVAFAERVAAEIAAECPGTGDYTLDVATGPGGPLVVELNEALNFGLYAASFARVLDAVERACHRRAAAVDLAARDGRPSVVVGSAPAAPPEAPPRPARSAPAPLEIAAADLRGLLRECAGGEPQGLEEDSGASFGL
jgi:hypothetical protein